MIGIGGSGGDKRADGTGFGDAFLKDLAVFGFLIVEQRVHIHGLVELSHARVDAHLAKQRLHAERASFVRDNGHNQLANLGVAQQFREQAHEHHGG